MCIQKSWSEKERRKMYARTDKKFWKSHRIYWNHIFEDKYLCKEGLYETSKTSSLTFIAQI